MSSSGPETLSSQIVCAQTAKVLVRLHNNMGLPEPFHIDHEKASEYDQEIPKSHTADHSTAL